MQIDWTSVEAVILDLGGVILNIDYQATIDAYKSLGFNDFELQYSKMQQSGLFDALETGKISEKEYVSSIRKLIPHASTEQIIDAWNAMLLDFPEGRIATVEAISARFPTFLLSNTNAIHYRAFNKILEQQYGIKDIKPLFKQAFLSHEIGHRKPEREAFELILTTHKLEASSTLFIDDSPQHIEGAKKLGIQCVHLEEPMKLETLFAPVLA